MAFDTWLANSFAESLESSGQVSETVPEAQGRPHRVILPRPTLRGELEDVDRLVSIVLRVFGYILLSHRTDMELSWDGQQSVA